MQSTSIRTYARVAGVLFLLSLIGGYFGEMHVPSRIVVARDPAATAQNILDLDTMFRWGFAGYLLEAVCDIALAWVMYVILRPAGRNLALLSVCFGLVSTSVFAVAQFFFFGSAMILGGADYLTGFSPDQLNSLSFVWVRMYGLGAGLFLAFYGLATGVRGYLIYRSDYLPRFLGALLMLAGLGFIARNFVLVLAPAYVSNLFLVPMFFAGASLTLWMLVKGVDVAKWEASAEKLDSRASRHP
jgi:Domain of unknown function (DUF4386)